MVILRDSLGLSIGTFGIVRDLLLWWFSGCLSGLLVYLSGLSGYPLGRDVIEWDAAWLSGITEGMSCEAMKPFCTG